MHYVILLLLLVSGPLFADDHSISQPKQVVDPAYIALACCTSVTKATSPVVLLAVTNPGYSRSPVKPTLPPSGFRPVPMEYG